MAASTWKAFFAFAALATAVAAAPSRNLSSQHHARDATISRRATTNGRVSFGYFPNWVGGGDLNYTATNIPVKDLTHVLYSFMDVDPATGELKLSDPAVDNGNSASGTLGGQLGKLFELKTANRHLKTLFSVGGWTYSESGHFDFIKDKSLRETFVAGCIKMIDDHGFDGVDIDYEHAKPEETADIVALFKELRAALTKYQKQKADPVPYLLTSAVFTRGDEWTKEAAQYHDWFNIMAYDFSGTWVPTTAHQSNLFSDGSNGGLSVDAGVTTFLGITTPDKIVLGMPLYGRAFTNTTGFNKPYNGVGANNGIRNYKDLPARGPTVTESAEFGSSYSFDNGEFVSYDTPLVAKTKSKYILDKDLAGSMFWDISTDKVGADSIVQIVHKALGKLDTTPNHLNYPGSVYDNVKEAGVENQAPGGGGGDAPTGTTSAPPEPTSTTPPQSTNCAARRKARKLKARKLK